MLGLTLIVEKFVPFAYMRSLLLLDVYIYEGGPLGQLHGPSMRLTLDFPIGFLLSLSLSLNILWDFGSKRVCTKNHQFLKSYPYWIGVSLALFHFFLHHWDLMVLDIQSLIYKWMVKCEYLIGEYLILLIQWAKGLSDLAKSIVWAPFLLPSSCLTPNAHLFVYLFFGMTTLFIKKADTI